MQLTDKDNDYKTLFSLVSVFLSSYIIKIIFFLLTSSSIYYDEMWTLVTVSSIHLYFYMKIFELYPLSMTAPTFPTYSSISSY